MTFTMDNTLINSQNIVFPDYDSNYGISLEAPEAVELRKFTTMLTEELSKPRTNK